LESNVVPVIAEPGWVNSRGSELSVDSSYHLCVHRVIIVKLPYKKQENGLLGRGGS